MFVKDLYAEHRPEALTALIEQYRFGSLVTMPASGVAIDHFPFTLHPELGERGLLRCHADRSNPIRLAIAENPKVLIAFQGANAYISPNWMPGRQRHRKTAPSWNYAAVHVYGNARVVEDADWLRRALKDLAASQEAKRAEPWTLDETPPGFIEQLLNYIVGIEISIERMEGKWFVGQHRSPSDRAGVVSGLLQEGTDASRAVAAMMDAYAPKPLGKLD